MHTVYVPGTTIPFPAEGSILQMFRPVIHATDGLTLGQVCKLTGLEPSTVQNWVKRGFVAHPVNKKYHDRQLARILLIAALRDSMKLEQIGALMTLVNGDADDESDAIISEEQLYEYLCAGIARTQDRALAADELSELVQELTTDYAHTSPATAQRLQDALTVMICAWIAGQYKQVAERRFLALSADKEA